MIWERSIGVYLPFAQTGNAQSQSLIWRECTIFMECYGAEGFVFFLIFVQLCERAALLLDWFARAVFAL